MVGCGGATYDKVGLVGDYVVRESASTAGAYVLVLKLSPTEFIEQKIVHGPSGYAIQVLSHSTIHAHHVVFPR